MATPRLISVRDFNTSRFAQLADTSSANIADTIVRAERAIEQRIKRPLSPTVFTERHQPTTNTIYLRQRPIISIDEISRSSTFGGTPFLITRYYVDQELGILQSDESLLGYIIMITYTAGFEQTPEDIKEAILMQTALFAFTDLEIYGQGDAKEPGILYMKDDISELLAPYEQLHVAYTR